MTAIDLTKYEAALDRSFIKKLGNVTQVIGLTIESDGPEVKIGDVCHIKATKHSKPVASEVVGFKDGKILLMPLGDMSGVGPGSIVEAVGKPLKIRISERMLGRVINGLGEPIDEKGPLPPGDEFPVTNSPPNPLLRTRISEPLPIGVKAVDALLTIGKGQRVGIFAGSGVGKSTLLGMIARNTTADICVIALVGERGREVREFLERDLGEEGLKRSIVVIATSDQPALMRLKAAEVATAAAEYFRNQGKDVMLMMDSLTRYAMAQREIGLAIGEVPVSRGYTPSVFATMPKLLERAGTNEIGSITAMYTVLVDGDDMTEPVTDTARSILDGHIALSRKIAARNRFPAIDVLGSVSRVMPDIVTKEHRQAASSIRKNIAVYNDSEDLINIGAYTKGSSADIDEAIAKQDRILEFLNQDMFSKHEFDEEIGQLMEIAGHARNDNAAG